MRRACLKEESELEFTTADGSWFQNDGPENDKLVLNISNFGRGTVKC